MNTVTKKEGDGATVRKGKQRTQKKVNRIIRFPGGSWKLEEFFRGK